MATSIVLTLTGPDRVGIVEEVTEVLLGVDGNVETSRMARLGGEFAILMLASVPADGIPSLQSAFSGLVAEGYKVTVGATDESVAETHAGWLPYRIAVEGADHEGIVHEIARGLSRLGITIESAETTVTTAPVSGAPLFSMEATVLVPPSLDEATWLEQLSEAGSVANVDVEAAAL